MTAAPPKPLAAVPPHSPPPASRMALANVTRGRVLKPARTLVYGPEGVGKTTFAVGAPSPIVLGAEDGLRRLETPRFPQPNTFDDVLEALRALYRDPHDYKTLVVDTVDWLEPLIWNHICLRDKKENVEDYGYGKGYNVALEEWRRLVLALERVREDKGMQIILLGHSQVKTFKNPLGADFDRYSLKVHEKAAGTLKEWADTVLFANLETFAVTREGEKKGVFAKGKGVSSGARLVFTERTVAYDAKNRDSLPPQLPLSWPDYETACLAGQVADPEVLVAACQAKALQLGPKVVEQIEASLKNAGKDAQKLSQLNNWLNAKLAAEAAEKES